MGLLEDPAFKAKYTKSKYIVRQWENDFLKTNGSNPTKVDIHVAPSAVKDAYKTYYKLKTLALEESLKDSFVEDVENTSICENPELQCQSNVFDCKSQESSEKSKHFRAVLKDIQNEDSDIKKGLLNDEVTSKDTVWGQHLNKLNIPLKKSVPNLKHSTSVKFTDKLFVASKFNKRNPRKMRIPNSSQRKTEESTKSVVNVSSLSEDCVSKSFEVDAEPPTSTICTDEDFVSKSFEVDTEPPASTICTDTVTNDKKFKLAENLNPVTYKAANIIHRTIMDMEPKVQPIIRERRIDKGWLDRCVEVDTCLQKKVKIVKDDTVSENIEAKYGQINSSSNIKNSIDSDDDVVCNSESEDEMRSKIKFSYKRKFSCISENKSDIEEGTVVKKVRLEVEQISEKLKDKNTSTVYSSAPSRLTEQHEHFDTKENPSNAFTTENCRKIAKRVIDLEKNNSFALKKGSRPATKKEILEDKVKSGRASENFVRINLKKKVYVRGKKTMNATKYKKMEWKKKKKENAGYKSSHEGVMTCFKCGDIGHFAKNCHSSQKGDKLLPLDDDFDDSPFPTLDEVTAMAAEPIFYSKRSNMPQQTSCSSVVDSNDDCSSINECDSVYSSFNMSSRTVQPVYSLNEDGSVKDTPLEVLVALQKFGHKSFRPGQEEAIMRILSGLSTLVVLSTGSGKSLCYQLPAYLFSQKKECITIVISPLVSLMEDQVIGSASCVKIACLHTSQTPKQRQDVIDMAKAKKLQILLISPEAIISGERTNGFGSILKDLPPIAFACIDEAHCISQWSHNFRPSYLMICRVLKEKFNVKTILGLTATATKSTCTSILQQISIPDGEQGIVQDVPLPDNLILSVSQDANRDKALLSLLQNTHFKDSNSIIIYCTRRQECDRLAVLIRTIFQDSSRPESTAKRSRISWNAESYHAGLSAARRKMVQKSFMSGKVRIVVATVAFGMGINKPDIRAVVHYNMPCSFESYVQEVGRAGRDGLAAYCHLFLEHEGSDKNELRRHIYANSVDRHVLRKLLQRVFVSCKCKKIADLLEGVDLSNTEDSEAKSNPDNNQMMKSENLVKCPGHEVAFSVEDTVQALDLPQENIETLLCYLELHGKGWIKVLSPVYTTCKVTSYKGAAALKAAAKKSPPLAMAIALDQCRGISHENSTKLEFNVVEIAASIDWDSGKVKHHLKQLEWMKVNDKWRRTGITVEFMNLGFRVNAPGIMSPAELDEALDSLADRVLNQEKNALQQLHSVFSALSSAAVPNYTEISDSPTSEKNQHLKYFIRNYFSQESMDAGYEADEEISAQQLPNYEEQVSADVRRLVCSYRNSNFTGRSVARIFHGIQSPCFPAQIWGKCKFWRAHLHLPFRYLCQIATREILSLR